MKLIYSILLVTFALVGCKHARVDQDSNVASIQDEEYLVGLRDVDPQLSDKLNAFAGLKVYDMVVCTNTGYRECAPVFAPLNGKPVLFLGGKKSNIREKLREKNIGSPEAFKDRFKEELYEDLQNMSSWEKAGNDIAAWMAGTAGAGLEIGGFAGSGCAVGAAGGAALAPLSFGASVPVGCTVGGVFGGVGGFLHVLASLIGPDEMDSLATAAFDETRSGLNRKHRREQEIAQVFNHIVETDGLMDPKHVHYQNTAYAFKYLKDFFGYEFNVGDPMVREWLASAKTR